MIPKIVRIGKPGKFDPVFGLTAHAHPALMDPLWVIVWLDSGEQVLKTGGFVDPIQAEGYVEAHRTAMINRHIEDAVLL